MRLFKMLVLIVCAVLMVGTGTCTAFFIIQKSPYVGWETWSLLGLLPTVVLGVICFFIAASLKDSDGS